MQTYDSVVCSRGYGMIEYKFKISKTMVNKLKSGLNKAIEQAGNKAVAQLLQTVILRTNQGKDYENKQMAPYSKDYSKVRHDRGRGSVVNLQMTSQMIQSITISHTVGSMKWTIAAHGSDSSGMSNAMKLHYLATDSKAPRVILKLGKVRLAYLLKHFNEEMKKQIAQTYR